MSAQDSTTKVCTICQTEYPATTEYFHRFARAKDGLKHECKTCAKARLRVWQAENRDKVLAYKREGTKRYYRRNKPAIAAKKSAIRKANREKENASKRDYRKRNPDQVRAEQLRRRARAANAEGTFTQADIHLQYKVQKGKCWWCGVKLNGDYHVDHIIPLDRGGTNWPNNIVCSCAHCNCSRQNKLPHEWNGRLF